MIEFGGVAKDLIVGVIAGLVSPLLLVWGLRPRLGVSGVEGREGGHWIRITNKSWWRAAIDAVLECRLYHNQVENGETVSHITLLKILAPETMPRIEKGDARIVRLESIEQGRLTPEGCKRLSRLLPMNTSSVALKQLLDELGRDGEEPFVEVVINSTDGVTGFRRSEARRYWPSELS
jgi:hypothetical protein